MKNRLRKPLSGAMCRSLLVLAVVTRGLFPNGFMPGGFTEPGGFFVHLCTSVGMQRVVWHPTADQQALFADSHDQLQQARCGFDVLLFGVPVPELLRLLHEAISGVAPDLLRAALRHGPQIRPSLPARGPPTRSLNDRSIAL